MTERVLLKRIFLVLFAFGCGHHAPPPVSPTIDVRTAQGAPLAIAKTTDPDAKPARLPEDVIHAPGCFAWSASERSVACVVGAWSTVGSGDREPSVVFLGPDDRDEATSAIDERLAAGNYVELPVPTNLGANGIESFEGFTLRFTHVKVYHGGENSAPRYDLTMVISHGKKKPSVIRELSSIACATPVVQIRELRGVGLVVEQICHIADEGEYGVEAEAWLCVGTDCH